MKKTSDSDYWLYDHKFDTQDQLFDLIEKYNSNGTKFNVLLLSSDKDIKQYLYNWVPKSYNVDIKDMDAAFSIILTKNHIKIKIIFVRYSENPALYIAISNCKTTEFYEFIKFINKYFPDISNIFLTNNEMSKIFQDVEKLNYDIMVEYSVGKKRLMNNNKESTIKYTNKPYREVFDEIAQNDQWIQTIRYRINKKSLKNKTKTKVIKGTITRDCRYSIINDFQILRNTIIPNSIKLSSIRNKHLSSSSKTANNKKPEPIVIDFGENVFTDIDKNSLYINAITTMRACSVSQYHSNPYLHISLVDYLDGSSYDIWVLTSNKMIIIPHFVASVPSMKRLVNHIFERIHDGKVEKYKKMDVDNNDQ